MRLIDGDEVQKKIVKKAEEWQGINPDVAYGIMYGHAVIADAPTIEAEPKHGRWIWNKRLGEWYCSNCDRIMTPYTVEKSDGEYEMAQPFYCGWCGADMRGEEDGKNS